jgi:transcriptional regulator with PAS, ATPase and Fis domain
VKEKLPPETLKAYLPDYQGVKLPAVFRKQDEKSFSNEREILYKILFDMKSDMNDLKKLVLEIIQKGGSGLEFHENNSRVIKNLFGDTKVEEPISGVSQKDGVEYSPRPVSDNIQDTEEIVEESLSLSGNEMELIIKALEKHNHKRKIAAKELGISERTLYRKIKEYGIGL